MVTIQPLVFFGMRDAEARDRFVAFPRVGGGGGIWSTLRILTAPKENMCRASTGTSISEELIPQVDRTFKKN